MFDPSNGPPESSSSASQPPERIVTASLDKAARLWLAESGEELAVLRGHEAWVDHAAFSSDGSLVVTASAWDKTARVWLVNLSDLLELAQSRLPVPLTPEERARILER